MGLAFGPEVRVVDSHTGGEPTRVVLSGGPRLDARNPADAVLELQQKHDHFRRAIINEPRGSDILIGALMLPPQDSRSAAGVVFFNNAGYLGMCGHGAIGVAITLLREQQLSIGTHQLETPAGTVQLHIHDEHNVSVENVASYRYRNDVALEVPGIGIVHGDIAFGGNWFFLVEDHGQNLSLDNSASLTDYTSRIRKALEQHEVRGKNGALIDHIELFGPPADPSKADSRNFVLCPGSAYDRSPCGTGTSAKLACLLADNKLAAGEYWRQESITGSIFAATARQQGDLTYPTITGAAFLTARSTLIIEAADPFASGFAALP
jgi:4-hydroxyproline epimerase